MPCYTVGLDLGQANDYSALVVVERVLCLPAGVTIGDYHCNPAALAGSGFTEELHVRSLRRWELGTPYPSVVADVCALMASDVLADDAWLFVDRTGIGRAVVDLLTDAFRAGKMGRRWPVPVTITSGEKRNGWNIPKTDLIDAVQVPLQQGRLRIADSLPLASTLEREMVGFRQKISTNGSTTFDHGRDDGHGDLVMALALALVAPNTTRRPALVENPSTLLETR